MDEPSAQVVLDASDLQQAGGPGERREEPRMVPALRETCAIGGTTSGDGLDGEFVALYELHYPRVVRALELGGARPEVAEDCAQEAFARTLVHWWRVRRGANPPGYVYRVAFRLVRRRARPAERAGVWDGEAAAATTTGSPGVADPGSLAALQLDVEAVIAAMPPARRSCAVLCLVADCSPLEAARLLGIAPSTVRKQLELARRELRAAIER